MRRVKSYLTLRNQVVRAISEGGFRPRLSTVEWDRSGSCTTPLLIEAFSRAGPEWEEGMPIPLFLDSAHPCRRCPSCLRFRAHSWAWRAASETLLAKRTWFGTFTLRPEEHYRALASAELGQAPTDAEVFRGRHRVISKEVTRYLKRVRMETGSPIRFMWVCEAHKSGLPHYHALIHETDEALPVRYRQLKGQWKLGFSEFELVKDEYVGAYVSKYLAKSNLARVRASIDYGLGSLRTDVIKEAESSTI